jgi:WD40 repeat protein/serine/threonine protein kinase
VACKQFSPITVKLFTASIHEPNRLIFTHHKIAGVLSDFYAAPMWDEDLLQVRAVFDEIVDLDNAERQRYLALHHAQDAALCGRVAQLLAHEVAAADFLEAPVLTGLHECWRDTFASLQLGVYRIERELGRGGMGVVYLAVRADDAFHKRVAIKLVWPGLSHITDRFRRERQMLADLEHPHIARLLDGGATPEGWQYLVMEYVEGVTLTEYCQQHNLSVRQRLNLFLDICAAVQHAHQHLIIHRDLKPSNILVTSEGQVKLLDFGIAKALDASAYASDLSLPGLHLMTPEYASPEQLTGAAVTTASDVYSLGVVLFELLAGQRPFQFASRQPHEVARVLSQHAPPLMSQVRKSEERKEAALLPSTVYRLPPILLRGDLDSIVARALQPEPNHRYASVAQLSEDIRRHLNGEVVEARKPTLAYRANRFIRRHKVAFSAGTAAFVVLLLWLAFLLRQVQIERAQDQAQRRQLYAAEMKQAQQDWKNNDLLQMQNTLARWQPQADEEDLRGFEYGYLQRLLNASTRTIPLPLQPVIFGFYPRDHRLLVGLEDQTVKMFDLTTGKELLTYPGREAGWANNTMHSTKQLVRMQEQRLIVAFDGLTGQVKHRYHHPHGRIQAFVYHYGTPVYLTIAEESGAVSIVNVATQTELFRLPGQGKPVSFFNFSVPHNLLVTVTNERLIRVDDITGRQPSRTFTEPTYIRYIEIAGDGQKLILLNQTSLHVRDSTTGRVLHSYPVQANALSYHALVKADGNTNEVIAIGKQDGTIELCAFPTFRLLRTLHGHTHPVSWLGFTPDNQFLLSTATDRTLRLWDWRTGKEKAVLRGHTDDITLQDFVDGKFVTASQDRTVRIWDVNEVTKPERLTGHTHHILTVAFSPAGQHVASSGKDNTAIIHDTNTGTQKILRGHQNFVYVARFSPDGRWLATGSDDGTAKIWEVTTGQELKSFIKGKRPYWDGVRSLAFLPDGQTLLLGTNDGAIIVWDVVTNQIKTRFQAHPKEILSLALSPDAKLLASGGWEGTFKLWDTTTWQEKAAHKAHQGRVWTAVFSPDGKQLATSGEDQTIKLWDAATLRLQHTLVGHSDEIFQVAYTPDGRRLASASNDNTVKLWNPNTEQELLTLREHTNEVWGVAFAPDGRTMLTGSWDKTLRLWRAVSP